MLKAVHRAKYVLAEPFLLLQNAAIHISDSGRILRVEPWHGPPASGVDVVDWGSAIILPGLINAHSHLELTLLHNQLTQFSSFSDWILQLIRHRQSWTREKFEASIQEGARLSISCGTTLVGDITASGMTWDAMRSGNLRCVVFEEIRAFSPDRADQTLSQLNPALDKNDPDSMLVHGVSPHAPYSVSSELYRCAAEMARNRGMPMATHVAETLSELQFLETGTGEFRDLLSAIGALPDNWKAPGQSPILYLESLGALGPSCLLIHCNYLDQESITRISATHSNVIYCPRSHAFFGHEVHPIRQLLDCGINVALGTDSLASNDSLSMIDEMRFLFKQRRDIKSEEIFRAATLNAAIALGFVDSLGLLKIGCFADMAVLELPQNLSPRQMISQILEGAGECSGAIIQGRIVWRKWDFPGFNAAGSDSDSHNSML